MKIQGLITHLQNNYDPGTEVAYDLWVGGDIDAYREGRGLSPLAPATNAEILRRFQRGKDCEQGLNWTALAHYIDEVVYG